MERREKEGEEGKSRREEIETNITGTYMTHPVRQSLRNTLDNANADSNLQFL